MRWDSNPRSSTCKEESLAAGLTHALFLVGPRGIEPRHTAFQTAVLTSLHQSPIKLFGGNDGFRSRYLDIDSVALSRLSYISIHLAPQAGLEPAYYAFAFTSD